MAESPETADFQLGWLTRRAEATEAITGDKGAVVFGDLEGAYVVWHGGEFYTTTKRPSWLEDQQIVRLPERSSRRRRASARLKELGAAILREDAEIGLSVGVDSAVKAVRACYGKGGTRAAESVVEGAFRRMLAATALGQQPAAAPPRDALQRWLSESEAMLFHEYLQLNLNGDAVAPLAASIAVWLEASRRGQANIYRVGAMPQNFDQPVRDVGAIGYSVLLDARQEPKIHRVRQRAGRPLRRLTARYVVPLTISVLMSALSEDREVVALHAASLLQQRADGLRNRARSELAMETFLDCLYGAMLLYKAALVIYRSLLPTLADPSDAVRGDLVCEEMRVLIASTLSQCVDSNLIDFADPAQVVKWAFELRKQPRGGWMSELVEASRDLRCPRFLVNLAGESLIRAMLENQDPALRSRSLNDLQKLESRLLEELHRRPPTLGEANYLGVTYQALDETARLMALVEEADRYREMARRSPNL